MLREPLNGYSPIYGQLLTKENSLAHAIPDPRLNSSEDTDTLSASRRASQAAVKRADYIASVVAAAPPLSAAKADYLSGLLRTGVEKSATPFINERQYQSLELKRYVDNETPGKFGFFTADGEAAA